MYVDARKRSIPMGRRWLAKIRNVAENRCTNVAVYLKIGKVVDMCEAWQFVAYQGSILLSQCFSKILRIFYL